MPNYAVTVPDTVQAAIYHDLEGRLLLTSLTYRFVAGSPTIDDGKALGDYLAFWWRTSILPLLSRRCIHSVVVILSLDHGNFFVTGPTLELREGGEPSDPLPNNVCFRIEFDTALDGRAHRGWNMIPAVPLGAYFRNTVKDTWADGIVDGYNAMLVGVAALGWEWVITSTMEAGAPRTEGFTTPVTLARYKDLIVDSSRHRQLGRRFS